MANLLERNRFDRTVEAVRHWTICAVCAAALASCGGGQTDAPAQPASLSDATAIDASFVGSNECGPITLRPPRAVNGTQRVALTWQGPAFKSVTVLVKPAADKAFEPVDALVMGNTAEFSRGPSHLLDFPTAQVRVRGCTDADGCVDSNDQPLLDALLDTVAYLPSPTPGGQDSFGSAVAVSADGNTLAVSSYDRLHLFQRNAQGRWQDPQVLDAPACARFILGSAALDGAGATLAASSEPAPSCPPQAGTIEVFARSGARWERAASITDERVEQRFAALSLDSEGRTLAAATYEVQYQPNQPIPSTVPWSGRARVYARDGAGPWVLATTLVADATGAVNAALGTPRLSGNGMVLAVQGGRDVLDPRDQQTRQPDPFVALYTREGATTWTARTMVRSTKPEDCCFLREENDRFGVSLALDHEGNTLAVGASGDNSDPSDTVGDPNNLGARDSGAVWIYTRTAEAAWSWQAFVKAPGAAVNNTNPLGGSFFLGTSVALDRSGRTLVATAIGLSQPAGVNRNHEADRDQRIIPNDPAVGGSSFGGAAYVFARDDAGRWTQRAAVLPPLEPRTRTPSFDGFAMAFSADASTLVLGVTEIEADDSAVASGVFVY